jgi:hypothetical protein
MIYLAIFAFMSALWITFDIWRAPLVDQNDNIIQPRKTLKDLFKNKTKQNGNK